MNQYNNNNNNNNNNNKQLLKHAQHSIRFNKNVKFITDTVPKSNIK